MSLDDIRQREQAATEGPWKFDSEGWLESEDRDVYAYIVTPEPYPPDPTERVVRLVVGREPDAKFISNARTDIPFLLDERDKLRAALDAVLDLCTDLDDNKHEHVEGCEGEPTCPACWSAIIRKTITEALR